jgi:hypothetical protein
MQSLEKSRTVGDVAVRLSKIGCGELGGRSSAGLSTEVLNLDCALLCFALHLSTYTLCNSIHSESYYSKNVSIGKTLIRHQDPAWRSVRLRVVGVKNLAKKVVDACGRRPGGFQGDRHKRCRGGSPFCAAAI